MKTDIGRQAVKDAATIVARTVGRRTALPALAGILVEAHPDGTVTLSATDLDQTVQASVPGDVVETGRVLVPAAALKETVRAGADRLTLAVRDDGSAVDVTGDGATVTLPTLDIDDYPALPDRLAGRADGVTLTGSDVETLGRVAVAAGTDGSRPVLTGVYVDTETGEVAATDSYRLHVGTLTDADGAASALGGATVPARAVQEVGRWKLAGRTVRAYARRDDDGRPYAVELVGVHVTGPKSARRETVVHLQTRTIEGTFPNYRHLWPDTLGLPITFDSDELTSAVDQVRGFVRSRPNVPVSIDVDGQRATLTVQHRELGSLEASARIVGPVPDGWPAPAFAPALLAQAVAAVGAGVTLHVREQLKPAVLTGGDGRVQVLLMPMRVN